jgi:hypothetical protein
MLLTLTNFENTHFYVLKLIDVPHVYELVKMVHRLFIFRLYRPLRCAT